MKEITVKALTYNLPTILEFIESELEAHDCPMKASMQIAIAVEEIFVNIAHYAYKPEEGPATICCEVAGDPLTVTVRFQDRGSPYNPLEKEDPDVQLTAEDRNIGGLGIYMVKKSMDEIDYCFENDMNIFTIKKKI